MARVAPFCHGCHWDGRGPVGRAKNKVLVTGMVDDAQGYKVYQAPLDLCQVCFWLYEHDPACRVRLATRAGLEVAKNR